jgi:hypothetical protein
MREILSELSSIATALEELTARITALADRSSTGEGSASADDPGRGDVGPSGRHRELAAELYTVERSLDGARRRLLRAVDKAGE